MEEIPDHVRDDVHTEGARHEAAVRHGAIEASIPTSEASSDRAPDHAGGAGSIARGGLWAFLGLGLGAALQFGYNVGLARAFGAAEVGIFAFAFSLTSIAAVVGQFGARETLLRYVAMYRSLGDGARLSGVLRQMATLAVVASTATGLAIALFAPQIAAASDKPEVLPALLILAWTVPLFAAVKALAAALQGAHRIAQFTLLHDIGRPLTLALGLALAVALGAGFTTFLTLSTVALGALVLVGVVLAWREFRPALGTAPRRASREWLAFSGTVIVLDLLRTSTGWVDTIIVGFFAEAADVGVYFAALRIALLITLAIGAFSTVMSPIAAGLWSRGDVAGLGRAFTTSTRWTCAFVVPATVTTLLLRQDLLGVFGGEFSGAEAQTVLVIVILGRFVLGVTGGVGRLLVMTGHQRVELFDVVVLLTLLFGGTMWAVPRHGLVGAAVVNALAFGLVNTLKLVQVWHYVGIQPFTWAYLKLVAAGAASAGVGWLAHGALDGAPLVVRLVAVAAAVGLAFVGALVALRLEPDDRAVLAGIRRRLP